MEEQIATNTTKINDFLDFIQKIISNDKDKKHDCSILFSICKETLKKVLNVFNEFSKNDNNKDNNYYISIIVKDKNVLFLSKNGNNDYCYCLVNIVGDSHDGVISMSTKELINCMTRLLGNTITIKKEDTIEICDERNNFIISPKEYQYIDILNKVCANKPEKEPVVIKFEKFNQFFTGVEFATEDLGKMRNLTYDLESIRICLNPFSFVGTDGHRLSIVQEQESFDSKLNNNSIGFLVKKKSLYTCQILYSDLAMYDTNEHLAISSDVLKSSKCRKLNLPFYCLLLLSKSRDKFPAYLEVLEQKINNKVEKSITIEKNFLMKIAKLKNLTKNIKEALYFEIKKGSKKINILRKDEKKEVITYQEEYEDKNEFDLDLYVRFNPKYIQDLTEFMIYNHNEQKMKIKFIDTTNLLFVEEKIQYGFFIHLLLPIKLS